jgi:arginyl-tRNA synthetase
MSFLIAYASPVQAIVDQLARAIANLALPNADISSIPIRTVKTTLGQLYTSPVGLQLAAIAKIPAAQMSQRLIEYLPNKFVESLPTDQALWDFHIWADDSGWIYARLSDNCIAAWLQRLSQSSPVRLSESEDLQNSPVKLLPVKPLSVKPLSVESSPVTPDAIFQLQYAHARCCSLIRLAHREKLLHLQNPDPPYSPHFWQVIQPQTFPWLTATRQLYCQHPSERALINQLFEFPGLGQRSLHCTNAQEGRPVIALTYSEDQLLRQAQVWSDRIHQFNRDCRIWGEVRTENPNLSLSRLGLLIAAQSAVRFYLQDLLSVPAPLEV